MSHVTSFVRLLRGVRRPKRLHTVILFVTSRCNAKCRTCFYWSALNREGDLTLSELEKLSRTMPPFAQLLVSGGEPTLRDDLPEIVWLFSHNNGIESLNLPTNGLKPERPRDLVERILRENEALTVYLNFSVDGLAETHDRIRAVPGNFAKVEQALALVQPLRERFRRRLWVGVVSVICRENSQELIALAEYFLRRHLLDGHYFQIVRGDPLDPTLASVPPDELRELYRRILRIYEEYARRAFDDPGALARWMKRMVYVGTFAFHHRVQWENYAHGRAWPMPCTAGETSVVIDFNGDVRACELRRPLANLRDYDMDFAAFWRSVARREEVAAIAHERCFCTHVCFLHDSLRFSPRAQLVDIPRSYILRRVW